MTGEAFNHCLKEPSALSVETLPELQAMVEDYPYFALGAMLYLKNLAQLHDPSFPQVLERFAIRVPDRRSLFYWVNGEETLPEVDRQPLPGSSTSDSFSLIDAFLMDHAEDEQASASLLFQPSASSDYLHWSLVREQQSIPVVGEEIGKPKLRHQELIDSFIANESHLVANRNLMEEKGNTQEALPESISQLEEQPKSLEESCLTETLARIYIKQQRYEKALQIIQNLRLKYPEKNSYFADQIRFLEKLIINTKK